MKYFIYTRKSTESEERQVMSLESQFSELKEFAAKEKLEIVASLSEAQTAKEPVKNVGSNPRLASRSLSLDFKNPWQILSETPVASLCDAPNFGENANAHLIHLPVRVCAKPRSQGREGCERGSLNKHLN